MDEVIRYAQLASNTFGWGLVWWLLTRHLPKMLDDAQSEREAAAARLESANAEYTKRLFSMVGKDDQHPAD